MLNSHLRRCTLLLFILSAGIAGPAIAADIGQVKVAKGQVTVERNKQSLPVTVGMRLQPSDVLKTGDDGSVGVVRNSLPVSVTRTV